MLIEIFAELLVDELLDETLDVAIELAFGLAFELRLRQLYGDDGDEAFADVITGDGDFVFLLLEHPEGAGGVIDGPRERGAKTGKVRAAVNGVDRIGEGENIFGVAVVILQRDFHVDRVALALHIDGRIVEDLLAAIEVLDEFRDAPGETKLGFFGAAFVLKRDRQPFVKESEFAQALRKSVVAISGRGENRRIGMKGDFRSGFLGFTRVFQLRCRLAFFIALLPDLTVAPDFQIEPLGKSVDDGNPDAVQASGNLVGVAIEFAPGVKNGHDNFGGGLFLRGVHVDGNAAAVVRDGDGIVIVDDYVDFVAVARQRFVDRVVANFPDEVMQAEFAGRANVHGGTFAHRFDAAKNFDRSRVVLVTRAFGRRIFFFSHSGVLLDFESGRRSRGLARHLPCPLASARFFFAKRNMKLEWFFASSRAAPADPVARGED